MNFRAAVSAFCTGVGAAALALGMLATASAEPGLSADEIARERAALRAIMAQNQAPAVDAAQQIRLPDAAAIGADDAPVLIIEFGDYQCGFCRRHVMNVMPALVQDHVVPGRVRYVFMEYPAENNLPASLEASNAALCADDQGRYWEMRQQIYANPMSIDAAGYRRHAQTLGLDMQGFDRCLEQAPHVARIEQHLALGRQLGVRGTPTFFVAVPGDADGDHRLVRRISGAQPLDLFEHELGNLARD
jgi:protein-disulfide isomerase